MKYIITYLFLTMMMISLSTYAQTKVIPEDLKTLIGSWEGSLTYLDYQTNKPFTMPATVVVKQGKIKIV